MSHRLEELPQGPACRHVERQARRMNEMIEKLGVDTGRLVRLRSGDAYLEARTRCLTCAGAGACLRWLDGGEIDGGPAGFCPNLPMFESCRKAD